jgi:hypothetical protein
MSTRTVTQLGIDFPMTSTPLLIASIALFDNLVGQGFLGSVGEVAQIYTAIEAAIEPFAEVYGAPGAVYTGAAGAVARLYSVVPKYPLKYPAGSAALPGGNYLDYVPGKPPWGWPPAAAAGPQSAPGTPFLWGIPSPATDVADTAAALAADDYVTITTPAEKYIPGTLFDIIMQTVAGGPYVLVAASVPPATPFVDNGNVAIAPFYGLAYTPRTAAEVGYDPNTPEGAAAGAGTIIYGPLTRP